MPCRPWAGFGQVTMMMMMVMMTKMMMMIVRLHCLCALISKSFYSVLSLSEPADSASWQINWKSWSVLTWWHKHAKHEWQEREMHKIFLKKHNHISAGQKFCICCRGNGRELYFRLIFGFPNILRVMSYEINEPCVRGDNGFQYLAFKNSR